MKKLLSLILALMLTLSLAACTERETEETAKPSDNEVVEKEENKKDPETKPEDEENTSEETEKEEVKEEKEEKPSKNPEVETAPEAKPESSTPSTETETAKTVGQTLLSAFKANSSDSATALSIAETLVANDVIAFSGGAMSVEEGYLTGFDNTEIKGFKEGAMFAPMIGTIPFVGYVFTLAEGTNAADFIATLKDAANLRWNICTSADEMVTGSSGNKVFFVMCPTSFEDAE